MFLYRAVNRLFLSRSYLGKILFVSFLGVHVPIIGAVTYILLATGRGLMDNLDIVLAMLVATLIGTMATLVIHHGLLAPVRTAARSLNAYLERREIPALPTKYGDEAGLLMANVQESITRLDAALDALQAEKDLDQQHYRGKLELLSSMGHELRTPLNHIIGFAELMSSEVLGPMGGEKYKDYAQNIGASGSSLMETVKVLTEIGEKESGSDAMALQPVRIVDAIEEAIGLQHFRADQKGILLARGDMDGDLVARSDPRAIKQALGHTFQAAIAMISGGGALCRVDAEQQDGRIKVVVACGVNGWLQDDIPPELRHEQLDMRAYSNANSEGGIASVSPVAVHLSLVSTLMRMGGGALRLESRGGKRFMILSFGHAVEGQSTIAA